MFAAKVASASSCADIARALLVVSSTLLSALAVAARPEKKHITIIVCWMAEFVAWQTKQSATVKVPNRMLHNILERTKAQKLELIQRACVLTDGFGLSIPNGHEVNVQQIALV
jgi:pyridoxine 5'-phosphate synthase PdxJ